MLKRSVDAFHFPPGAVVNVHVVLAHSHCPNTGHLVSEHANGSHMINQVCGTVGTIFGSLAQRLTHNT